MDIECIVYGTYYAAWSKICQQGITRSPGRTGILCFSCVPKVKPGPKAFQLLIFVDFKNAMQDGIKFHRINDRHILCTGDRQGFIRPKYFLKVLDCENSTIIFPPHLNDSFETAPLHSGQQMHGINIARHAAYPSHGRGRGAIPHHPQGMQMYENIWSQLQQEDSRKANSQPSQSQILLDNLNNSERNTSAPNHNGRTEVSVEDIFRGAMACTNQTLEQSSGVQGNTIISLLQSAHQSHQMQGKSSEARAVKDESPVKSAFVPTQVIRKQTPRKPKPEQPDDAVKQTLRAEESPGACGVVAEKSQAQQPSQRQNSHSNPNGNKKPRQSRLAVKFNQPLKEDT